MAIDIMRAATTTPPPLDFVLPGLLAGTVGTLFSPGATGKSYFALEAAFAVASAGKADPLGLAPEAGGRVMFLAAEDPQEILERRIHAIAQHLSDDALSDVAERLVVEPVLGAGIDLMDDDHAHRVVDACQDTRLLLLDTVSRFHGLDENSNGDMGRLVKRMEWIAVKTGAAILYLHHVSKASVRDGAGSAQQASRGASALVDNARWGASLRRMTDDEAEEAGLDPQLHVRLEVPKNNYGRPLEPRWFSRDDAGVLVPCGTPPHSQETRNGSSGAADRKRRRRSDV